MEQCTSHLNDGQAIMLKTDAAMVGLGKGVFKEPLKSTGELDNAIIDIGAEKVDKSLEKKESSK